MRARTAAFLLAPLTPTHAGASGVSFGDRPILSEKTFPTAEVNSTPHNDKRSILEGVYEENRRIRENRPNPRPTRPRQVATPRPRRSSQLVSLSVVALLAVVGVIFQVVSAESGAELSATAAALRPVAGEVVLDHPLSERPGRLNLLESPAASGRYIEQSEVPIASLFDLRVKTIVIDAGHGGRDPGAVGESGLTEAEITLDVARRLKQRLERAHNYRIVLTRTGDEYLSLRDRVRYANEQDADLFISLHVNYLPVEPVTSVETYYFGTDADATTMRLAERENRHSDYTVAEFNEMLQNVGRTMKAQESKQVATSIQRSLYRNIRQLNRDVSDWGVKSAPFMVLLGVQAPSVLAEIAVLSNRAEEEKLAQDEYREMLAAFLEEGVSQYLKQRSTRTNLIAATP